MRPPAERVDPDPRPSEQHLAVHRTELLVARPRVVAVAKLAAAGIDLPLEIEADRYTFPDLAAPRVGGIVERDAERLEPVGPVLERCLAHELAPESVGPHLQSDARQRHLVVAHDDRPGAIGKEQVRPPPRDAERGRARELHRDAGSVAARDVELPGLPPTVATGRMRTLVGGAERHGIGG